MCVRLKQKLQLFSLMKKRRCTYSMKAVAFLLLVAGLLAVDAVSAAPAGGSEKPHIVMHLVDDWVKSGQSS